MALEDELREFVRAEARIVFEEMRAEMFGADEWLTVKQASELTHMSAWHIRQLARDPAGPLEVYQPNQSKPPLRIRRASLKNLAKKGTTK